jgi:hypothetical protein
MQLLLPRVVGHPLLLPLLELLVLVAVTRVLGLFEIRGLFFACGRSRLRRL